MLYGAEVSEPFLHAKRCRTLCDIIWPTSQKLILWYASDSVPAPAGLYIQILAWGGGRKVRWRVLRNKFGKLFPSKYTAY